MVLVCVPALCLHSSVHKNAFPWTRTHAFSLTPASVVDSLAGHYCHHKIKASKEKLSYLKSCLGGNKNIAKTCYSSIHLVSYMGIANSVGIY